MIFQPSGVVPDIIVFGKGIAGGYAPLSAVVAPTRLAEVFARGSGAFNHAQTFSPHPVLCAAGVATIRYLRRHQLVERCAAMGPVLHRQRARLRELPHVCDVRGRGLLAGVELVEDKDTRAPFPREARVAERLTAAALDLGLVVWPNVGHADGTRGDLVMVAPPFIINESEIAIIVDRLEAAMMAAGLTAKVSSGGLAAR